MTDHFFERRKQIREGLENELKSFVTEVSKFAKDKTDDRDLFWAYLQYEIELLTGEIKMELLFHALPQSSTQTTRKET